MAHASPISRSRPCVARRPEAPERQVGIDDVGDGGQSVARQSVHALAQDARESAAGHHDRWPAADRASADPLDQLAHRARGGPAPGRWRWRRACPCRCAPGMQSTSICGQLRRAARQRPSAELDPGQGSRRRGTRHPRRPRRPSWPCRGRPRSAARRSVGSRPTRPAADPRRRASGRGSRTGSGMVSVSATIRRIRARPRLPQRPRSRQGPR